MIQIIFVLLSKLEVNGLNNLLGQDSPLSGRRSRGTGAATPFQTGNARHWWRPTHPAIPSAHPR
eukprot:scaffold283323_cov19-Prasinocladus_malaysianus.AAC.1